MTATDRTSSGSAHVARVVEEIKLWIRQGTLRPGQRLPSERELATRMGVSRSTIREAVHVLAAVRLLESRRGDGTYMREPDHNFLTEQLQFISDTTDSSIIALFEVRKMLEPAAAGLAAVRASPAELEQIRRLENTDHPRTTMSPQSRVAQDSSLHSAIINAARNPILIGLLQSLYDLTTASRKQTVEIKGVSEGVNEDHHRIVEAISSRDPEASVQAMLAHLERVESIALKRLYRHSDTSPITDVV